MPARPHPGRGSRSFRSESGSILILTAFAIIAMLGIAALAVDASFMYTERNRMHAAADAAAKSAAYQQKYGVGNLQAFANREVAMHGFAPNPGGDTDVTVNAPPQAPSAFAGQSGFVQVIVERTTGTFFGTILGRLSLRPGASAVAGTSQPVNCLIVNQDATFGNTTFTLNGCSMSVGGDLTGSNPNATVTGTPTPSVSVTGTCNNNCGSMGNLATNQPPPINPMAGLPPPTVTGACGPATLNPLPPGCYTNIPSTITQLMPGTFKVTGTIDLNPSLTGSNVLLYLTSTALISGGNNGELNLTAGNTAPYAGIAIYGDPGSNIDAKNGFTLTITGAIYMPGSDIDFKNHLNITDTGCSLFVFNNVEIKNGNSQILKTTGCAGQFSNAAYLGVALAE